MPTSVGSVAVPVTRTRRVCGTSPSSAPRVTTIAQPVSSATVSTECAVVLPAHVGLDAAQHDEVAVAERRGEVLVRGPGDRRRDAVDELDARPARLVVDVLVGVDRREALGVRLLDEPVGGRAGRVTGVVPAFERGDEQRVAQVGLCSHTKPPPIAAA